MCPVCCDEVEPGEDLTVLTCHHAFHAECLQPWLKLRASCPVCRQKVSRVSRWQEAALWRSGSVSPQPNHAARPQSVGESRGGGGREDGEETSTAVVEMVTVTMEEVGEEHRGGEEERGGEGGDEGRGGEDGDALRVSTQSRRSEAEEVTLNIHEVAESELM